MRGFDWSRRPDITARILEVYRGRLLQETTDIINGEFGTSFRSCQIRGYLQNRGLKTGLGSSKKGIRYFWKPEYEEFVRARLDKSYDEIIGEFEEKFGIRLTWGQLGHFKWRNGLYSENDGRYKAGHMPANVAPLGAEHRQTNNFIKVKVSDERHTGNGSRANWKSKGQHEWEKAHGPMPEGCMIIFRDGDDSNYSVDNLVCVTKAQNETMNAIGARFRGEYLETGVLMADISMAMNERVRNERDDKKTCKGR